MPRLRPAALAVRGGIAVTAPEPKCARCPELELLIRELRSLDYNPFETIGEWADWKARVLHRSYKLVPAFTPPPSPSEEKP